MRELVITQQFTDRSDIQQYLNDINKIPMITPEEEVVLAQRIKLGDQSALEKLVRANLRFVVSVAKQYQNNGLTLSDLINEGNLGLIKAAQRFDETKGFKFISYAVWWIRQSILQALSETASLVRLPMNKVTVKNKANKIAEVFEQEHETTITNQELAELMGMSEYELSQILGDKRSFSLDAPLTDESDSITRGDLLVDQTAAQNEQHGDNRRLVEYVLTLNVLKDQEKDILRLFFGIGLQDPVALENIGEQINLTRERVRQIKDKAIEKLQSPHVKKLLQQRNAGEERKNRGSHIRSVSSPSHFGLAYLQQDPIEEDLNSKGDPEQVEDNTSFFSRDYPREIGEEPKKNTKPVRYSFRRPKTESPKDNIGDTSSTPKKPIKYNGDIQQDTDTVAEDNGINQFALKTLLYIQNMQVDFDEMIQDRDKHFPDIEYRDYQIEKVKKILQGFCNKELGKTDKLAVADITPPRGGKTILMAILAKLMRRQGIPSVISMWNAQAMDGPDNGLAVYHKFFSEDQIGMIDAYHKEYNKPITLITGTSFARHFGNLPKADHINIMLDEGDTFQTDLRQNALSKYNIGGKNFISMYSATTYLNGRDITDWADISDEMHLVDQIKLGFSKNIQGYYYTGDIELTDEKMIGDHMEYDLLHEAEKQWLQKAVVNICQLDTNKKTIVTCQNINQCKETKKMLQQAGFSVEYIVENTPGDERRRILESYIHDDLQVILHVQVLGRSFSDKGITQRVIQAVISGSPTRVYQNILRGTTPHNEYDVLEIYQLIPSTIKTRSFMPVLMHQCFGIALDEYERWIQIDDKRNVSGGQPISFVSHKKKKGTVDEKAGVVEFLSVERLQEVVNTRTLHKQYNDYIKEHFMELMKGILEKHKKTIFNIGGEELHDAYTTVRIGNSDMDISLYTIYSAVGVILFGDLGKTELRQTINPLIKKYIQERYVYGEIPLQASLETHGLTPADIQKLIKKVFRKKNLFTNEFLTKHALDILDIFIQEQDIKPERPDLYVGKHVTYQDLTLSYGQLLMSMLKQCGQVSHDIAHYNIKAASHILWSWKEKNKSPSVLETRRCIIEHVLEDNKNGYFRNNIKYIVESFLGAEGIDFTELGNISVQQEKKNTISISSTQVKEFLRIIGSEKYVELVQAESAYELNYEWRSMIISLVLSYFDVKWLKENKLAWSNVKNLNVHLVGQFIQEVINGTMTRERLRSLQTQETILVKPSPYEYRICRDMDIVLGPNRADIVSGLQYEIRTKNDPIFSLQPLGLEESISLERALGIFLLVQTGTSILPFSRGKGLTSYRIYMNTLVLFKQYFLLAPEDRSTFSFKEAWDSQFHTDQGEVETDSGDEIVVENIQQIELPVVKNNQVKLPMIEQIGSIGENTITDNIIVSNNIQSSQIESFSYHYEGIAPSPAQLEHVLKTVVNSKKHNSHIVHDILAVTNWSEELKSIIVDECQKNNQGNHNQISYEQMHTRIVRKKIFSGEKHDGSYEDTNNLSDVMWKECLLVLCTKYERLFSQYNQNKKIDRSHVKDLSKYKKQLSDLGLSFDKYHSTLTVGFVQQKLLDCPAMVKILQDMILYFGLID